MQKPEVRYTDLFEAVIGRSALVFTEDHPVLETKGKWRRTSPVVSIADQLQNGPVFETENTIYLPHSSYVPGQHGQPS